MKRIDIELNKKTIIDNNYLKAILEKTINNSVLSYEELVHLYDVYNEHLDRTLNDKLLIDKIISHRNIYEDMAKIFNCQVSEVTNNSFDVLNNPTKYVVLLNDIMLSQERKNIISNLKYISGDVLISNLNDNYFLQNLISIGGDLQSYEEYTNLNNLRTIRGSTNFLNLIKADGLANLRTIGTGAKFDVITESSGLDMLEYIGGNALFYSLEEATHLSHLSYIGNKAFFNELISSKGLEKITRLVEGYFPILTDASGLCNLKTVEGDLSLKQLKNANGLSNLISIGGTADFDDLIDATALKNLIYIGGNAYFNQLETTDGLNNLSVIGDNAVFLSLKNLNGLDNLKYIGGKVVLSNYLEDDTQLENILYFYDIDGSPPISTQNKEKILNKKIKLAHWNK